MQESVKKSRFGAGVWFVLALVAVMAVYTLVFRRGAQGEAIAADDRRELANFTVPTIEGGTWSLADQKGKVVLVNFWATWCPPCRAETPDLVAVANKYRDQGLTVVGISLDQGTPEDLKQKLGAFAKDFNVSYPIATPGSSDVAEGISSIPVTLLLDRQGRVANRFVGAVDQKTLSTAIEALLAEQAPQPK